MAQITTAFGFKDNISSSLNMLNRTLQELNKSLNATKGGAGEASQGLDKLGGKASGVSSKLINFNMATQAFRAVKGAVDSVTRSMGEMSAAYNFQMEQETKLETVMKNHMKASTAQIQSVKDYASELQKSGIYGDEMILQGAQELATYVEDPEVLKQLMPTLNSMLAQGVGMNATSRDMQSYATMLGKVMQGQVGGMSKRGYKFTEAEEEILKTGTELQKLQVLQNNVLGNFGDMNKALAQTPQGQIIQLNNRLGDMKEELGKALIPFNQLFSLATANWKITFYETILKGLNLLRQNIDKVMTVMTLLGVAAIALAGYFIYLKATAISTAVATAIAWISAHLTIIAVVAVIGIAIVGLIVILSKLVGAANVLGAVFGGVFGFIKTIIVDTFKSAYNLVVPIINQFLTIAEFFYNVWKHPIDSLKALFFNFVSTIIDMLGPIGGAIDGLLGTHITSAVNSMKKGIENAKKNAVGDDYKSFKHLDFMQTEGIVQGTVKGAQFGMDKANEINDFIKNFDKNSLVPEAASFEGLDLETDSSGALVTADKNVLELSDEYKELLSTQAKRKFNMNFTQMTPKVDFGDVIMNNTADGESLLEALAEGLERVATSQLRSA